MDCGGCQWRIFHNLHDACHIILFHAAGFPTADPAGVDPDSLAADLGAPYDTIGRDAPDDVDKLLQRIPSHLCQAPIPDVH
jgi:hypothetical protein